MFPGAAYIEDTPYSVELVIANIGDTNATIVSIRHRIYYGNFQTPTMNYGTVSQHKDLVEAGGYITKVLSVARLTQPPYMYIEERLHIIFERKKGPFVFAEIDYIDTRNVKRRVSIHRRLNSMGRFEPIPESDHEYED
jgi:hypothetical protein